MGRHRNARRVVTRVVVFLLLGAIVGTNGDHELFLSPGMMYESRKFTLDATVMIPAHQEVNHRAESEIIIGIGLRLSF